jgi:predicted nucleic-acid-binding protein
LDTNILVRWLVQDDADQTERVDQLFNSLSAADSPYFVPVTVLLELEWVLRSRYKFSQSQIVSAVTGLLETREVEMQEHAAIEHALHLMRHAAADFIDCLHAGLAVASQRDPLLTFDVGASRLPPAQLI